MSELCDSAYTVSELSCRINQLVQNLAFCRFFFRFHHHTITHSCWHLCHLFELFKC